jgi:poly-gamma-glutamate synthesis protein (capsule biosynthesis protein)
MKKSYFFLTIILTSVIVILLGLISIKITNKTKEIEQPKKQEVVKPKPIITKVYFVGDMMLARGVQSSVNKNFGGDFSSLFENVPELKEADILFANLEGPISEKGNNVGSKYSFRIKPAVLPVLKEAGFDILSFANNHVGDWNVKAFNDTLVHLKDNNILVTGAGENKAEAEKVTIIEKNGIRFGFIGFSDVGPNWMQAKENSSGILLASDPNYASIISKAKEECDFLFVSIHFGEEYKKTHIIKDRKICTYRNRQWSRYGYRTPPTLTQDMEEYNGKTIITHLVILFSINIFQKTQ